MALPRTRQTGNIALIISVAVLVLGLLLGGVAVILATRKKPVIQQVVQGPSSPYDALSAGSGNSDLQYDSLNVQSGLKQEGLNLQNVKGAVNDTPQTITAN